MDAASQPELAPSAVSQGEGAGHLAALTGDRQAGLISAVNGREANRERAVAHRTRRVLLSSLGVLQQRNQDKSRARALAVGIACVVCLLIAPLLWEATDSLIAGEHLADPGSQLSLWACMMCPTLLGAALLVGWLRKRS